MPYLIHKHTDGSTIQYWNLHEGPLKIGRGPDANSIEDGELSREHFQITSEDDKHFTLKDLTPSLPA